MLDSTCTTGKNTEVPLTRLESMIILERNLHSLCCFCIVDTLKVGNHGVRLVWCTPKYSSRPST